MSRDSLNPAGLMLSRSTDNAQSRYRHHIASEDGYQDFCHHFGALIEDALDNP